MDNINWENYIEKTENGYKIEDYAFEYRYDIKNIVIPDYITSIGNNTFFNCRNLTSITIPNSVTSIGENAFDSCQSLTNITIPNRVTFIREYTFHDCKSLISITIPDSITMIGKYAFSGCSGLTSIKYKNYIAKKKRSNDSEYWEIKESITSKLKNLFRIR